MAGEKNIFAAEAENIAQSQAELSDVKLQFGLREGKLVAVGELSQEERGLKCGCICPVCKGVLFARLGKKRQAHFAHYKTTNCDVASAQQTALHMLAKDIIAQAKGMYIPAATVSRNEAFTDDRNEEWKVMARLPLTLEYRPAGFYTCSDVILEEKISGIIPDIVMVHGQQRVLVEIAVTHFIGEEKQNKIEELGLPVLEVDLSDLKAEEISREELRKRLLDAPDGKEWAFLPDSRTRQASIEKYNTLYKEAQQAVEEEERQEILREEERRKKQAAAQQKYNRLLQSTVYRETLIKQRDDEQISRIIRQFRFSKDSNYSSFPFFLDIPTNGDLVFDCDRRIWQAAIFDNFIYNRNTEGAEPATVHVKKIASWAVKHQKIFRLDGELMPRVFSYAGGHGRRRSLLEQSIEEFMWHLYRLGFISKPNYSEAEILAAHSIVPPNEEAAKMLVKALSEVDLSSIKAADAVRERLEAFMRWREKQEEKEQREKAEKEIEETALRREKIKKERQAQYIAGKQEILDRLRENGPDENVMLKDSFANRWLWCISCGSIARDIDMASYGGKNSANKGICRECSKQRR